MYFVIDIILAFLLPIQNLMTSTQHTTSKFQKLPFRAKEKLMSFINLSLSKKILTKFSIKHIFCLQIHLGSFSRS